MEETGIGMVMTLPGRNYLSGKRDQREKVCWLLYYQTQFPLTWTFASLSLTYFQKNWS